MTRLATGNTGVAIAPRAILLLGDFAPGDTPHIERLVEAIPGANIIDEAWLTFKLNESDPDPGILQLHITEISSAQGHIVDPGGDGVGLLRFTPTAVQTALLTTPGLHYDIALALADGSNYTVERGRFFLWLAPLNPWEGTRGATGLIREKSLEPLEGQPRPYENELLDDFVAGDDYNLRRFVYGLPTGRTVTAATLTVVDTPGQLDPGLFQLAITNVISAQGKIEDAGSGAPRRADLRFAFSTAQTALMTRARGWRMRVTLDDGRTFTVLRGTIKAPNDVTDIEGTGSGATATVEVTPDPFSVIVGATKQLTAVAKNASNEVIPGESFTWASTNEAVATVDANGLVTGVAPGTAIIRATAVSNGTVSNDADATVQIVADLLPAQASLAIVWQPNDGDSQLEVDSKGSYDNRFGNTTGSDTADPTRDAVNRLIQFITDDIMHAEPAPNFDSASFVIVLERIQNVPGISYVISHLTDVGRGFELYLFNNALGVGNTNGSVDAPSALSTGALHWIVFRSVSGFGRWQLFVDGASVAQSSNSWNTTNTNGANPRIRSGFHPALGDGIANLKRGTFALWLNYELTDADIVAIGNVLRSIPEYASLP
jgi:hypothetical protein